MRSQNYLPEVGRRNLSPKSPKLAFRVIWWRLIKVTFTLVLRTATITITPITTTITAAIAITTFASTVMKTNILHMMTPSTHYTPQLCWQLEKWILMTYRETPSSSKEPQENDVFRNKKRIKDERSWENPTLRCEVVIFWCLILFILLNETPSNIPSVKDETNFWDTLSTKDCLTVCM